MENENSDNIQNVQIISYLADFNWHVRRLKLVDCIVNDILQTPCLLLTDY